MNKNINIKKLTPSKLFYQTFKIYQPNKKCRYCHQIIKTKRPNMVYYFLGYVKKNPNLLRVKVTGRKTILRIHKHFFKPFILEENKKLDELANTQK